MKRIKSFGVAQTAKVFAVIYFVTSAIIFIPFFLFSLLFGLLDDSPFAYFGTSILILAPVFYGIVGFVIIALACLVYNFTVKYTGGIELEVE